MSSSSERNAPLRFSLRITGWFLLIFLLTTAGLYLLTSHVIHGALEDEWAVSGQEVKGRLNPEGEVEGYTVRDVEVRATPTPELKAMVMDEFDRLMPVLMAPMILVGLLGGLFLTYRAAQRVRSLLRTVQDILSRGEIERRVPLDDLGGNLRNMGRLFNQSLDRNEALIRGLHESLDHVAHDLRTPLTRLRATAEAAVEGSENALVCRAALADCLEESDNVLSMLNTLMDYAEAETGAMRLEREPVDVGEAVASVAELYELVAEERGSRIETTVEAGLTVDADRNRLRQALANLVDNALKYSPDGTEVRIDARRDGDDVVLQVTDRGRGIPEADLPRIWDRLYRGDRSRHEKGLGLGLSLVRGIVEAHGGRVAVASRVGSGTTFTVRLPGASSSPPVDPAQR